MVREGGTSTPAAPGAGAGPRQGAAARVVRRFPALSLGVLAIALGLAVVAPIAAGALPTGFLQLGALSASAAGFILAWAAGRGPTVRELARRVLIWRVGWGWWLFALFFPGVAVVAGLYAAAAATGTAVSWAGVGPPHQALALFVLLFVFAGLGEEFGWRGFALPRLQARRTGLTASLAIGAIHSAWHVPLFLIEGEPYHALSQQIGLGAAVGGYAVLVIALAIQLTWLFNHTRGSVLLAAAYHGAANAWSGYLDVTRGGLAGLGGYVGVMALAALALVAATGPTLSRGRRPDTMEVVPTPARGGGPP